MSRGAARGAGRWAVGLFLLCLVSVARAQTAEEAKGFAVEPPPTLVVLNGRVWTGVEKAPEAEAVAVTGATITAVGSTEEMRAKAGERTRIIDAGGRRVIPGITDSHTHIIGLGLHLSRLDLRAAANKEDFVNLVAGAVALLTPGAWLSGGRFSVESWDDPTPPRKEWIDSFTPGTPVFLTRMDGHQALVNTVALRYARIDRAGPPDPPGGVIERDPATGEPTGILKDDAMELVRRLIPPPSEQEKRQALKLASGVANAWGITGVHDMSDVEDLAVFRQAEKEGVLTLRVHSFAQTDQIVATYRVIRDMVDASDHLFHVAGFKAYMDGSLGSRTAYMRAPYADATEETKYPRGLRSGHAADLDAFRAQVKWVHDHKLQMAIHAIGDQAIHEVLDIYASLPDCGSRRHRVEHAQHLAPEDIARFGKLGVIASMQPFHKADDGRYAEKAIGPVRAETSYAFKSLLDAGATVCFGSDCPVVTNNPFAGMAAAVGARTLAGDVWVPAQSISRDAALRCYTAAPAYASFQEETLGTLEVGKRADIVVLDTDILAAPIDEIYRTEAYVTILNGRVVWAIMPAP